MVVLCAVSALCDGLRERGFCSWDVRGRPSTGRGRRDAIGGASRLVSGRHLRTPGTLRALPLVPCTQFTRCPQVTGVYFGVCVAPPDGRVALDVGALRGCMCLLWIRRRGQAQREACAQLSVWMRLREGRVILLQVVGWRGPGGQCPPPAASLPSLPLACCVSSASNLADRPSRGLAPECPCEYRLREVVDVRRWGAPDGTGPGRPWVAF